MSQIDDLTDHWEDMWARGVDLSPEELCNDPALLDELRRQIQILRSYHLNFGCIDSGEQPEDGPRVRDFCPPTLLITNTRFRIEACHATGGLGQVFVAQDEVLGRRVAIKFPRRQGMTAEQIERFELEAKLTGQLEHPGIVPVHSLNATETGEPCYVMRLVEGQTLSETVQHHLASAKPGRQYWESDHFRKLLQALIRVANTVAYAHTRGIIHRDIKPQNILIGPFEETLLLDWGIAKQYSTHDLPSNSNSDDGQLTTPHAVAPDSLVPASHLTEPGHVLGTPAYASPEQLLGQTEVRPASDVYSLGMTLFFLISHQTPLDILGWTEYSNRLRTKTFDFGDLLPEHLPIGLRAIVSKATRTDSSTRYHDPLSFAADLDRYLAGEQLSILRESIWTRAGRWLRKHPVYAGGLAAGTAVFAVAALLVVSIVTLKNQQLSQSNSRLLTALSSVQSANSVAMQALRSMVNESVSRRMAQHEELSTEDRAYIDSILNQYAIIASLRQDLAETKALRAEAFGQVGSLYYHLNQGAEAQENLQQCLQMYHELMAESDDMSLRDQYVGFVEVQAALFTENGNFQAVEELATKAIDQLNANLVAANHANGDKPLPAELESTLSSLFMMRANARTKLKKLELGRQDIKQSVAILERGLTARPDDVSLKFQTGSNLRTFGSLLNDNASLPGDREQALLMANRSIELLEETVNLRPESRHYVSSLAWAYYDRSYIHEVLNQTLSALDDMNQACKWTQQIADKYPVIADYRKRVVPMIRRRAILYLKNGDAESAFHDAQIISKLDLTQVQLGQCIELLREIQAIWPAPSNQPSNLRDLLQQMQMQMEQQPRTNPQ